MDEKMKEDILSVLHDIKDLLIQIKFLSEMSYDNMARKNNDLIEVQQNVRQFEIKNSKG